MKQKGFANVVLVLVAVIIFGAVGYFAFVKKSEPVSQQTTPTPTPTPTPSISNFESRKENGKMVLYKVYSDGSSKEAGLEVTLVQNMSVNIVVSPDKTKAVFTTLNDTFNGMGIYISNIDGTNVVKTLIQHASDEGSSAVSKDSLVWSSDGRYIIYTVSGIVCEADCESGSEVSRTTTYQVNVTTGEQKVISKVSGYAE